MSAAAPVSTRTRQQRSSAPQLSLSTTLTVPSRIGKSRTPRSALPRSGISASPCPSSASVFSAISLLSARSFSTAASSPCSPHAAKAIAAVATPSTAMSALSFSDHNIKANTKGKGKEQSGDRKTRVVPWPSQMHNKAEKLGLDSRSTSPAGEIELGGYLSALQGALSRTNSVAGSVSPSFRSESSC